MLSISFFLFLIYQIGWVTASGHGDVTYQKQELANLHREHQLKLLKSRFEISSQAKNSIIHQHQSDATEHMPNALHNHFHKRNRADEKAVHSVVFACKQRNLDKIKSILHDVSNPLSKNYGKHLSYDEVAQMTKNLKSSRHIMRVLSLHGIAVTKRTKNDEYITAEAPVSVWESFFNTEFHEFVTKDSQSTHHVIRCEKYSLPVVLVDHVSAVFNTVQFPNPMEMKSSIVKMPFTTAAEVNITHYVTPAFLGEVYDIRNFTGSEQSSQAVYESIGQTYSPSDLTTFQKHFGLPVEAVAVDIGYHASDNACLVNDGEDCGEANLDVQYIMGIAQHSRTIYYYWNGTDFVTDWITQVASMINPPLVISISYGSFQTLLTTSSMEAFDVEAMKLGVRGVTITVSSGDDGVAGYLARSKPINCGYQPQFPAGSPYVTAVGGTMGPESGQPEMTCQSDAGGLITSGGGFSIYTSTPEWQSTVVASYLSKTSPKSGFNVDGRGYPDVSALSAFYQVVLGGNISVIFGTSASSPVFAGMVSLVNSARLLAGKSTLGWINPTLYQYSSSFVNDITVGENNCVAKETVCCEQGFPAATGWDPSTGLGSVNFTSFKNLFMSLGNDLNDPTIAPTTAAGAPSSIPTLAPVANPTATPTSAPTKSPGWIYVNFYNEENCEGTITNVIAHPTGVCLIDYDNTGLTPIGSRRYECTGSDFAIATLFSDTSCSPEFEVFNWKNFQGCSHEAHQYYYSTALYSTNMQCSTSSSLPLPTGTFAVESQYNTDDTSCTGTIATVYAFKSNYCFEDVQNLVSYTFSFPNQVVYDDIGCDSSTEFSEKFPLNVVCVNYEANAYTAYNDIGFVYSYYYPHGVVSKQSIWTSQTVSSNSKTFWTRAAKIGVLCGSIVLFCGCGWALAYYCIFIVAKRSTDEFQNSDSISNPINNKA
eukprot:gene5158-7181_t